MKILISYCTNKNIVDLPTHATFAAAVGLVFFGKPEIALLMVIGSLLPDLDREYWFVRNKSQYADEQIHRARLHNVFMMAFTYLFSPYLSLGVFLHVLQDSFTTVKDRGVEWFYPITRLVKRGLYDSTGAQQPTDPKEHVYFYQEDPKGLVNKADPDLREYGCDPVPWRRVYGFAQNSQLLDKGFLCGSILVILIWIFIPASKHFTVLVTSTTANYVGLVMGLFAVGMLFLSGELDRKDKTPRLGKLNFIKYIIFALGLVLLGIWIVLSLNDIMKNIMTIFADPLSIFVGIITIPIVIILIIKAKTRSGRNAII
jgi:hypothetical protein